MRKYILIRILPGIASSPALQDTSLYPEFVLQKLAQATSPGDNADHTWIPAEAIAINDPKYQKRRPAPMI